MYTCADDAQTGGQCSSDADQKFASSLQDAKDAVRSLTGSNWADAMRGLAAYGAQNQANGVSVAVGDAGGFPGATDAHDGAAKTDLNPDGQNIKVTFDSGLFLSNDTGFKAATVAHEGSHVADAEDWARNGFSDTADPTHFETEYRAYGVTTSMMAAFGATALSASHNGQVFYNFWVKSATETYNDRIGRPAMIKMFYPNWDQKAFQKNTNGGGQ